MPAISPARIDFSDPLAPRATAFGDVYHSRAGAAEQAKHVFLRGNDLPRRWQGRSRFVILETGFGLGNNFLAAAQAWRDDPQRCERLWFVSIEKHPPTAEDLATAHGLDAAADDGPADALAAQLVKTWPVLVSGMHLLDFDGGRIRLLLAVGEVSDMLRELVLQADAFFLDGFAPSCNAAMWDWRVWRALPRLAAPGATAATWSVARAVRDGLASAGFWVDKAAGIGGKREITMARHAPRHQAAEPVGRRHAPCVGRGERPSALIVGAGLAGAATAHALDGEGWRVTLIEAAPAPAAGASGQRAGLFHGLVNGAEGTHARWLRAAALHLMRHVGPKLDSGSVPGRHDGLLRLDLEAENEQSLARHAGQAMGFGWPAAFAQALSAGQASELAGVDLSSPAWWCRAGGWLDPRALVRTWLERATVLNHTPVGRLVPDGDRWQALDADGHAVAQADVVVLANAADASRLVGPHTLWPLHTSRGQITELGADAVAQSAMPRPQLPIAGNGYLLTLPDGGVMLGATREVDGRCVDTRLRQADHLANLAQARRLIGDFGAIDPAALGGRVGWRCSADDRLPLIGPVPAARPVDALRVADQPRHVARTPGLYVLSALGSRGITLAPLAGEVLASWISGAPMPIEASLLDAVDAARFVARSARSAGGSPHHG